MQRNRPAPQRSASRTRWRRLHRRAVGPTFPPATRRHPRSRLCLRWRRHLPRRTRRACTTYVYDSVMDGVVGYDRLILVRGSASKDGAQKAAELKAGDWQEIKLRGSEGLVGARAGQAAGFYVKLITLSPSLSSFKLYFTSVERLIATCSTAACDALPAGGAGEDRLEKYLAENVPTAVAADFAPLEARIIDEDTYVEQGRDLEKAYA